MKVNLGKRDVIKAAIKEWVSAKCKKLKVLIDSKIDKGVPIWLKQARSENVTVSSDLIKEKALKLAKLLHTPDFTASEGWQDKFESHLEKLILYIFSTILNYRCSSKELKSGIVGRVKVA